MRSVLSKCNYYFIASWLIIFIGTCALYPSMSIRPEIWGEAGSNFLPHALFDNVWQNLLADDAGYLPWFQRLLAVIIVKVFHGVESYAYATQLIATGFIALFCSLINLKTYRNLFPSDLLRFILGVSIAFIPDYEVHGFINFVYFGVLPVLLFLFTKKEKMSGLKFWLLGICITLIMLSKPYFVAFAPILLVMGLSAYKQKQLRSLSLYSIILFGFLLQIISVKLHPGIWGTDSSPLEMIGQIVYSYASIYKHVFIGDYTFTTVPAFLLFFIVQWVLLFRFIGKQLQKQNKIPLYFFLTCNAIALGTIAMTITSAKEVFPPDMPYFGVPNDRHFVFANIAILLAGIIVLQTYIKKNWIIVTVVLLVMVNSSAFAYFYNKDISYVQNRGNVTNLMHNSLELYPSQEESYSQWEIYHQLIYNQSYCIPLNPYPFFASKNCDYLNDPKEILVTKNKVYTVSLPENAQNEQWNIQGFILVDSGHVNVFKEISAFAYDETGKEIASAKSITPNSSYKYVYFLFSKPIGNISSIKFYENKKPVNVAPSIVYFGNKQK